jgi:hypothetical protein
MVDKMALWKGLLQVFQLSFAGYPAVLHISVSIWAGTIGPFGVAVPGN